MVFLCLPPHPRSRLSKKSKHTISIRELNVVEDRVPLGYSLLQAVVLDILNKVGNKEI